MEGEKMIPSMPPDSHKISLMIIEAIQQHPVLYISEVKGNAVKLQEFRQKVWKRIADELGLDPSWVKLKWKNLRDTYCRILKYKNKSTAKGSRRKKWVFEDHLSFLKFPYESDYEPQIVELSDEYIQEINSESASSQILLDQLEDREDEDYSEYLEVLEDPLHPIIPQTVEVLHEEVISEPLNEAETSNEENSCDQNNVIEVYVQQIESKYRKIRPKEIKLDSPSTNDESNSFSFVTPEEESNSGSPIYVSTPTKKSKKLYANSFKTKDLNNSVDLFFDTIAQTVKQLPPKAQANLKMDISKLVKDAEMRYSRQTTPQTVTHLDSIPKLVLIPCHIIDDQIKR